MLGHIGDAAPGVGRESGDAEGAPGCRMRPGMQDETRDAAPRVRVRPGNEAGRCGGSPGMQEKPGMRGEPEDTGGGRRCSPGDGG